MGTLSVRFTDRLARGSARGALLLAGLGLMAAGALPVRRGAGRRRVPRPHVFPVTLLMGAGAGLGFPALMTLAMSGHRRARTRAWLPAWSTPPPRWAGHWAWPCWPPCRPPDQRPGRAAAESTAAALTGGYHLAFWIGDALLAIAIVVTATVVRPGD